jgi:hypothetical protein
MPGLDSGGDFPPPGRGKEQIKVGMTRSKTAKVHFGIKSVPKWRRITTVIQKQATVIAQFATSAGQKLQP